jgi:hypothetical protein
MARKAPSARHASHKGMGFEAAAESAAAGAGVSPERGRAIIAAGARKASAKAKRANPNLSKVSGVKKD